MKKLLSFMLLACMAMASFAQLQDPAHWSFSSKDLGNNEVELLFTVKLDAGWHLYSQHSDPEGAVPMEFTLEDSKDYTRVGKLVEPKSHDEYEPAFKCTVRFFSDKATFRQKIKRTSDKAFEAKGSLYYQLCNDGSCIAPDDHPFTIKVKAAELVAENTDAEAAAEEETEEVQEEDSTVVVVEEAVIKAADEPVEEEEGQSLIKVFLFALAGGILTMFTPCVFPMIPMTVNFFMHGSDNKRKNQRQAWFFGLSIVFMFAVLGAILTLCFGPTALNFIGTHWIPNLFFFVIFIIFALSFFGLFEIKMPEKWINASDEKADKGGWMGPFFIALTTVLVSFSCTGPIIGAALVGLATSTVNRWVSLLTMLGFGIGFAMPFTLLAMFPGVLKNLKSGGWLNTVKVVFAFLELAFGLKFLQMADLYCGWRILDREVYLALWIVIFALMGFYLLGKLRFKGDEEVKELGVVRLFLAIFDLAFVVYMIPGLFGAPLNAIAGFLPPMDTQDFNIERSIIEHAGSGSTIQMGKLPADRKYADKLHMPTGFEGFYDLDEAKAWAKKEGKPIFIDFTGRNCNNCREMEQVVWSDANAQKILNDEYVMVALYADMNSIELPEEEWVTDANGRVLKTLGRKNLNFESTRFNNNAQPYYVIIDADENVLTKENFKYQKDVESFVKFLEEGVATYKAQK